MTRRYLISLGILLIPVVAVGLFFLWAVDWTDAPFDKQRFNAETWRKMKDSDRRDGRARMARNLIDHNLKHGMPVAEVSSLLGTPDKRWPASEYTPPLPYDVYEYDMGYAPRSIAGEHYVLRLYFDSHACYDRAEITRD